MKDKSSKRFLAQSKDEEMNSEMFNSVEDETSDAKASDVQYFNYSELREEAERKYRLLQAEEKYNVLLEKLQKEYQEKTNKKLKWIEILAYSASFLALILGLLTEFNDHKTELNYVLALTFITLILLSVCTVYIFYKSTKKNQLKKDIASVETQIIKNKIEDNFFENSIELSYKYLDQYYKQIESQAKKGFGLTVSSSVAGAVLIAIGIVAMFSGKVSPSYITCASGVLIEVISTVFFYMYNKTMTNMSEYHDKLVLSHNISIALKTAELLPEDSGNIAKHKIIEALLKNINAHLVNSKE